MHHVKCYHVDHADSALFKTSNIQIGKSDEWLLANAEKCKVWNPLENNDNLPCTRDDPCSKSHCPRSNPSLHYDRPIGDAFKTTHTMLIPISKRNAHKKARLPWCPTRCSQPSFPLRIMWMESFMLQTTNHYGSNSKVFHLFLQV